MTCTRRAPEAAFSPGRPRPCLLASARPATRIPAAETERRRLRRAVPDALGGAPGSRRVA